MRVWDSLPIADHSIGPSGNRAQALSKNMTQSVSPAKRLWQLGVAVVRMRCLSFEIRGFPGHHQRRVVCRSHMSMLTRMTDVPPVAVKMPVDRPLRHRARQKKDHVLARRGDGDECGNSEWQPKCFGQAGAPGAGFGDSASRPF